MGLARLEQEVAEEDRERLTSTGQVMGTCDYMAPEQALDTHSVDHRADIYSLGCTFYRLLAGQPPFRGRTHFEVLLGHREAPIPSLREVRPEVPEEVDEVCQKMMAKEPDDRYQSMQTVIEALRACVQTKEPALKGAEDSSDSALTSFLVGMAQGGSGTTGQALSATEETSSRHEHKDTIDRVPEKPAEVRKRRDMRMLIGAVGVGVVVIVVLASILLFRGSESGEGDGTIAVGKKEPPPLAIAPFKAEQARKHQEAWAEYLGLPVEWENSIGMKFVLIPPGEFMMGSSEEEIRDTLAREEALSLSELRVGLNAQRKADIQSEGRQHRVTITRPFFLGKYEITVAQFAKFIGDTAHKPAEVGSRFNRDTGEFDFGAQCSWLDPGFEQGDDHPVVGVAWVDASAFCTWLGSKGGNRYRLPTEAEWEFACRAGTTTPCWFGKGQASVNYAENFADTTFRDAFSRTTMDAPSGEDGHVFTAPVGSFRPNPFGLYDMIGNAGEYCQDWYSEEYYSRSPSIDPSGPKSGSGRVSRGGCYAYAMMYSATRTGLTPTHPSAVRGFRVLCEIPTDPAELTKFAAAIRGMESPSRPAVGNYALEFDGESSYVTLPVPNGVSQPATIEAWFEWNRSSGCIVCLAGEYKLHLGKGGASGTFFILDKGAWYDTCQFRQHVPSPESRYVHVAGVFDGGRARFFVDGREKARPETASVDLGPDDGHRVSSERGEPRLFDKGFWIGSRREDSEMGGFFQGTIDEVRISNIARYTEDFTPQDRFEPDEHTMALYHFDEGQGDVLHDSSGNGHHGKIVGAKWVRVETAPAAASPPVEPPSDEMVTLPNGWRFTKPVNLGPVVNSDSSELCPTISADGLTLFFSSARGGGQGGEDLWMCRRGSPSEPFGEPVNLGPIVNSSALDGDPALSADGLTLFFHSNRPSGQGGMDIWTCSRASPSEPFGEPVNFGPTVNSSAVDGRSALSADGLTLFFNSKRPGGQGGGDLWMCSRASPSEPFGEPVNLGPIINSSADDGAPALSADGRTLFLHSDRPGGQGEGDLWQARIEPPSDEMVTLPNGWRVGRPVNLGPVVNSSGNDWSPTLSEDGRTLIFCSARAGGSGQDDLWMCVRTSPEKPFGPAINLGPAVNGPTRESAPALSSDGLTLVFASDREGGQGAKDLWMSTRSSSKESFGNPINLGPVVNSSTDDTGAALSTDSLTLVFESLRAGGQGKVDLWMCVRTSTKESFGQAINLGPTVNSPAADASPALTKDGLALVFASDRPGGQGAGDLWIGTREARTGQFGSPVNLGPSINAISRDFTPHVSADQQTLYFSTDRPGGQGGEDLWMAPIEPPSAAARKVNDSAPPEADSETFTLPNGWRFTKPVNLGPVVNSEHKELGPTLSSDGLTLFFSSDRPGGEGGNDLWMCKRALLSDDFGEPVNLGPTINSPADEMRPDLSQDGRILLFHSDRSGGCGSADIWASTRTEIGEPFNPPVNLRPPINTDAWEASPHLSGDGLTLLFTSDRANGSGSHDLWMATRASANEAFGEPVNLGADVNGSGYDSNPCISPDLKMLIFYSRRRARGDLWAAIRPSTEAAFGEPVYLGEVVNTSAVEGDPFLSRDGRFLLFESDRPGGQGDMDIWMCNRADAD